MLLMPFLLCPAFSFVLSVCWPWSLSESAPSAVKSLFQYTSCPCVSTICCWLHLQMDKHTGGPLTLSCLSGGPLFPLDLLSGLLKWLLWALCGLGELVGLCGLGLLGWLRYWDRWGATCLWLGIGDSCAAPPL
ncbi:hypothetical protein XELAEV_18001687mg [Xenopus laevis]|uniref:Uncharacterized protein n=1 Tax=Xenopus laevis TaxID=8355 RepID=A0A974BQH2_XENLA|nr:hypothetical protein XELAEV_18001687mg [Xenopus laevis]